MSQQALTPVPNVHGPVPSAGPLHAACERVKKRPTLPRMAALPTSIPPASDYTGDNQKAGPHWGGFWPAEHVAELDDVLFEPNDGGYVVYSAYGNILHRFAERWRGVGALNRWHEAAFVVHDGQ